MKSSYLLAAAVLAQLVIGQMSYAQSQELNAEVDAEIEQMYKSSGAQQQPSVLSAPVQAAKPQQSSQPVVTQTIYVPQQPAVQKQPETQVEGSPLTNSRADSIRRGRQDEELRTETRIVEKLEQSRLEDEKKRASVLFGDKFDALQNQQQQQPVQPVQVAQPAVVPVAPVQAPSSQVQPVIINQNESLTRDAVREEVRAALTEDKDAVVPAMEQRYFSATAGIGQYPDVDSIKGNYSLGAAFGTRFDYFLVEGAFVFSNYTVDGLYSTPYGNQRADFDMNQYQGTVATKYQLLGGFLRPVVGGLISYSYREYELSQQNNYLANYYGVNGGTSHAIDLGLLAGVDLEFNSKMSFGVDMKYMFNMSSKVSGSTVAGAQTPEKLQYFTTGLFARVNF